MATSLLYHLFGIDQVQYLKTLFGASTALLAAIHPNAIKYPVATARPIDPIRPDPGGEQPVPSGVSLKFETD